MLKHVNTRAVLCHIHIIQLSVDLNELVSVLFSTWPEGYSQCSSQITFLSWILMRRNLWRGASPTPAWLGLNESHWSKASKRWKPLWAGQRREKLSEMEKKYESKPDSMPTWALKHGLYASILWITTGLQWIGSSITFYMQFIFNLYIYWGTAQWVSKSPEHIL